VDAPRNVGHAVAWCAEHEAKADFFTVEGQGHRVQIRVGTEIATRGNLVDAVEALAGLIAVADHTQFIIRNAEAELDEARAKAME
jgi:hypothetical protein